MLTLRSALAHIAAGIADSIAPQTCVACGQWIPGEFGDYCAPCRAETESAGPRACCPRCARFVAGVAIHDEHCAFCRTERFWNLAGITAVGVHCGALRRMVVGLKYRRDPRPARALGALLAGAIAREPWAGAIELLVPVPMHRLRRWQRPCDHAALLAEATARHLRLRVRRAAVRRVRHSVSQTQTDSTAARFENVQGCFGPRGRPGVAGKTVCIVDNLITSGATVCEVSKVLRRAGAKRIYAAVVTRAVLGGDRAPRA